MFAPPLLAFLLSVAARRNLRAQRLSFVLAYVGLPILYAAFNTFDPVHELIMRGISLAGGAAGSPRDATDSLVIPLAWAVALWVWRREPAAPGAMRLRWAVFVAGVAALASVATSYPETLYGVQDVGVSEDGGDVRPHRLLFRARQPPEHQWGHDMENRRRTGNSHVERWECGHSKRPLRNRRSGGD